MQKIFTPFIGEAHLSTYKMKYWEVSLAAALVLTTVAADEKLEFTSIVCALSLELAVIAKQLLFRYFAMGLAHLKDLTLIIDIKRMIGPKDLASLLL